MREIRPYGSARGVRSNPYPYRDTPTPHAKHGRILTLADTAPYPAASRPESAPQDLKRPASGRRLDTGSGKQSARETPADRWARTPRIKNRISRAKRQGPRLRSARPQ